MQDNTLVNSSFSSTIHAPIEQVDLPAWRFGLSVAEYQSCSPAHVSAAVTAAPDGRRMSACIQRLIVAGLIAHTCVESTVRQAVELGYDVTMVKDATADYAEEFMHAALAANLPNYASAIVTTQEVTDAVSGIHPWRRVLPPAAGLAPEARRQSCPPKEAQNNV